MVAVPVVEFSETSDCDPMINYPALSIPVSCAHTCFYVPLNLVVWILADTILILAKLQR